MVGTSEDARYIYFVASGVLSGEENAMSERAVRGQPNLYSLREEGGKWTIGYVATLSGGDSPDWAGSFDRLTSRVSPNGRYVAFMSERSLTGYDNRDMLSGQPDAEVYLYDALSGRVVCASCNPTGARPTGALDSGELVDRAGIWRGWVAANLPGWNLGAEDMTGLYQPRYLSDSGRLFFDSFDALVPLDTNGLADVYQYEPAGVGDCTRGSVGYGERSSGCVNLISNGVSSSASAFMDASESGNDVFFMTSSKLVSEDYDTSYDIYDARVCTALSPCPAAPVSPPPCTSGDSCKAAPSPQPTIFGPTPSATFSGTGNVVEEAKRKPTVRHKRKPKRKRKAKRSRRARRARAHGSGSTRAMRRSG
jgi:hypothetical protein